MHHILVYGSLRKHSERGYNFNRFQGQEFIKKVTLDGYELYDLGPYPALTEGNGKVVFELHSIEDDSFKCIQYMEQGAGYTEKKVNVDGIEASIFVWPKRRIEACKAPRVESGDWN